MRRDRRRPIAPAVVALAVAALAVAALAAVPLGAVAPAAGTASADGQRGSVDPLGAPDRQAPPDPDEDVLGWENGYWYNESIRVDQSDGLSVAELDRFVARTMARVEAIRGLEFTADVPVEFVSRAEMQAIARNRTFGGTTADQLWEALFVVGEDRNASPVYAEYVGSAVLGYAAEEGSENLTLVTRDPDEPAVSPNVLAHELAHVLQHQQFDLDRARYERATRDGEFGKDGLVEGEASVIDAMYDRRCGAEWDCVDAPPGWADVDGGWNAAISRMSYMPYSDGAVYVHSLYREGGWAAVDAAHESPPASSEQVIHYRDGDAPVEMTLRDRSTAAWAVRPFVDGRAERLGEISVWGLLHNQYRRGADGLADQFGSGRDGPFDAGNYTARAAAGWGNDRLLVYGDGDRRGYVWKTVWDTERDAAEFHEAYVTVLEANDARRVRAGVWRIDDGHFADAFRVVREGETVTIVNGPTVEALAAIRQPESANETTPPPSPTTTPTPTTNATSTATRTGGDETAATAEAPGTGPPEGNGIRTTSGGAGPGFGVVAGLFAIAGTGLFAIAGVAVARRLSGRFRP